MKKLLLSLFSPFTFTHTHIVDLTHTLQVSTPSWTGESCFSLKNLCDYEQCDSEVKFRSQQFTTNAGLGTHLDAPSHCFKDAADIDQIPLENLVTLCVVINVSSHSHERYSVSIEDIINFETSHGTIPAHSFVILYTGWSKHWDEPKKYHNNHVFPSLSPEAAQLLVERNIVGVGIDTLSTDRPDNDYPAHGILLQANKYIVENVANAHLLPASGSTIIVAPLKIKGATETPIRLFALIP